MKRALDNEQESRPSPKRALSFTCGITKGIGLFLGKPSSVNIALGTPKGGMVQTFRSMTLDQIVKHVKSNTEVHYGALCSASVLSYRDPLFWTPTAWLSPLITTYSKAR
jgi:hypothetical protein